MDDSAMIHFTDLTSLHATTNAMQALLLSRKSSLPREQFTVLLSAEEQAALRAYLCPHLPDTPETDLEMLHELAAALGYEVRKRPAEPPAVDRQEGTEPPSIELYLTPLPQVNGVAQVPQTVQEASHGA